MRYAADDDAYADVLAKANAHAADADAYSSAADVRTDVHTANVVDGDNAYADAYAEDEGEWDT